MSGQRSGPGSAALRLSALALGVFVLALLSVLFTRDHGQVAAIWPGNALALAALLRTSPRLWPACLAAAAAGLLAANIALEMSLGPALGLAACNLAEILLAALLCRRSIGSEPDVTRPPQLATIAAAAAVAPLASALGALTVLGADGSLFLRWYLADALGLILVTPALLALAADAPSLRALFRRTDSLAPVLALAAALAAVFGQSDYPVLFLVFPPLIWCAFTLGAAGTAATLLATTTLAVWMTLAGHGVAANVDGGLQAQLTVLQLLLASITVVTLPLSAVLAERRRLDQSLREALSRIGESEARYRTLTENASDIVLKLDAQGLIRYVSPSARRLGYDPEALVGVSSFSLIHPDDVADVADRVRAMIASGEVDPKRGRVYRVMTADGGYIWAEGNPSIVRDADGAVRAVVSQIRDISANKAAEDALAQSEARYRMLADNASDLVIKIDAEGVIEYVSPSIRRLGYEPEDMLGSSPLTFVHPDDVEAVKARMRERRRTGEADIGADQTYRVLKKHGGHVWVESNPSVIRNPDGSVASVISQLRDMTARRAHDEALAESEARYRMLADHASDVIIKVDADDTVLYVSPSVRRYGYEPDELLGIQGYSLVHPDDRATLQALVDELFQTGVVDPGSDRTYRLRTADGRWAWAEGSPSLVRNAAGEVEAVISQLRDVSVRKELEAELRAARDDAEAAAATKAEFMANMSHEIRTPLTAVLGFTAMLSKRGDLSHDAQRQVGRIAAAGEAMLAIVNDILDFSKLEAGLMHVTPRPAAPLDVLENAVALLEPQAAAKGLALTFSATDLPAHVHLDPDRVRQILLNLIGNAVKFTAAGQVDVQASYDDGAQRLRVAVSDSGAGMTAAQQARLFQRFSQVNGVGQAGGTGLGLAISRGLVEAMGGRIELTSAIGKGSTFAFEIPAASCDAPAVTGASEDAAAPAVAGVRLLLVDDNAANRELTRALMEQFEVEVTDASDGAEAVELAALLPYDVILLDIRMPCMDGPTAARRIRAEPGPNQATPILAFSAESELDSDLADLFDGHVRKPIEVAPLLDALVRVTAWEEEVFGERAEG